MRRTSYYRILCAGILTCTINLAWLRADDKEEPLSKSDRHYLKEMLHAVRNDIKSFYYDPKFHGLDLDARFKEAEDKIESAPSRNYAVADIAGAVTALNDSHTVFLPPQRPYVHDYGWRMQAEGDSDCFITSVRPGSDAAKNGIIPGDQVLSVNGYAAVREDLWKIEYVFGTLRPQPGLRLQLRSADGKVRQVNAMADLHPRTKDYSKQEEQFENLRKGHGTNLKEYGKAAVIYSLPDFAVDPDSANRMLDQIRNHDAVVLDLRGNPGGYEEFLSRFLGGMFDHEVKIGDRVGRHTMKALKTKSRGDKTFTGKLVVLIDSESASAAEIFARVVQLEKRGVVVGDRSSGKVMEGILHPEFVETKNSVLTFAVLITDADLVMTDGKSLENAGVMPDVRIVPTPNDLAIGRDPALAYAAAQVGVKLTPDEAGNLSPMIWPTH